MVMMPSFLGLVALSLIPLRLSAFILRPYNAIAIHEKSSTSCLYSDNFSELTGALARLDEQWKIQQKRPEGSRWKTLLIDRPTASTPSPSPLNDPVGALLSNAASANEIDNKVYLLEPPYGSIPSCILVFTGGAGLGTYPQVAYNELLLRLSNRLNAAILTPPYSVALDHFALAKDTGERAWRAVEYCQNNFQYPAQLPVYSLSHSLGGKLSLIHYAAMKSNYAGMGLIAFNNFGFQETVGMAREFARELVANLQPTAAGTNGVGPSSNDQVFQQLFGLAEMAVSAAGIDFSPTSSQMWQLLTNRLGNANDNMASRCRIFALRDDTLHSSEGLAQTCPAMDASELEGTHLTPVFFQLGLDKIAALDDDESLRDMVRDAMGGFEKASYGNEEELDQLVEEVSFWILGSPPTRRPAWKRERPQLTGSNQQSQSSR